MAGDRNWLISELLDAVADPSRYAGGGAVAAMSLAGAAATLQLVAQLSARRKRLPDEDRQRLNTIAERADYLQNHFQSEIDADMGVLTALMDANRELREARRTSDCLRIDIAGSSLQLALINGIESPLRVADEGIELLDLVASCQSSAVPFTMSDLGAAAATVRGATESMLLMAEVNLGMLEDKDRRAHYQRAIEERFDVVVSRSDDILAVTRSAISPDRQKSDS